MKDELYEKICCCTLNRIFGYKPAIARCLVDNLGSCSAVFHLTKDELSGLLGPFSPFPSMISQHELDKSESELRRLNSEGAEFLCLADPLFPTALKECADAPMGLYIRSGSRFEDIFTGKDMIAVVGTRDISLYGKEWCTKLVSAISDSGSRPVIVSGLAIGTDINAHLTALENGLPTIAVMATGIDQVYPQRHHGYASRIAATSGCALITDYPPGTVPTAVNFLRRNRIIAGLCRATILIESKVKGGGMMTSRLAFSYGREVYALPGRIDDVRSMGCNQLIQEKIAEPIFDAEDFIESLGLQSPNTKRKTIEERVRSRYGKIFPEDRVLALTNLCRTIELHRGITMEELWQHSDRTFAEITADCNFLENEGFICIDLLQRCTVNFLKKE